MTVDEIEDYRKLIGKKNKWGVNEFVTLHGYTSCSLLKSMALTFAWEEA